MSFKYGGILPKLNNLDSDTFINDYKKHCRANGYKFFTGPWNINLFGIRTPNKHTDTFDDMIGVIFEDTHLKPHCIVFNATTEPGKNYLLAPPNKLGTGIIVPGQYRGVWKYESSWGRFEYPILRQVGMFKVYRDNTKDAKIDLDAKTIEDNYNGGFQLHKAWSNGYAENVDYVSAGCQAIQDPWGYDYLLSLLKHSIEVLGYDTFTYTLIING